MLIANSNLVPHWATWEHFNELDRKGLMMYGQMTAGSWIYIGTQGIVQGTYETFVEVGRRHYGGDLTGKWILTAGLGGMGGAQPLAATMAGASLLAVECQPIAHRDAAAHPLSRRRRRRRSTRRWRSSTARTRPAKPVSVGLLGNAAEIFPELVRRGVRPDARHRPDLRARPGQWLSADRAGRSPNGRSSARAIRRRSSTPRKRSMARACAARCSTSTRTGVPTLDYGNNIRQMAKEKGVEDAFDFPGFVPAYIRPLFCRGIGPFRWAALSGDPEDIYRTDAKVKELMPDDTASAQLARHGAGAHRFPGPAGAHLLGRPRRPPPAGPGLQRDGRRRAS